MKYPGNCHWKWGAAVAAGRRCRHPAPASGWRSLLGWPGAEPGLRWHASELRQSSRIRGGQAKQPRQAAWGRPGPRQRCPCQFSKTFLLPWSRGRQQELGSSQVLQLRQPRPVQGLQFSSFYPFLLLLLSAELVPRRQTGHEASVLSAKGILTVFNSCRSEELADGIISWEKCRRLQRAGTGSPLAPCLNFHVTFPHIYPWAS